MEIVDGEHLRGYCWHIVLSMPAGTDMDPPHSLKLTEDCTLDETMSRLITRRRSVSNAPPALSPSTAPAMSAPLVGEPTPLTEAIATAENMQMKAHVRTQGDQMSKIIQALAMSGLQIQLPAPDLAPPSTSQPLPPADT